jgi:phosphate/sulfate permease
MNWKTRFATMSGSDESYVPVGRRTIRVLMAAVLLACLLVIVTSPFVDLPVSTMRAKIAALLCLLTLVAAACLLSGVIDRAFIVATAPRIPALPAGASPDFTCARLC